MCVRAVSTTSQSSCETSHLPVHFIPEAVHEDLASWHFALGLSEQCHISDFADGFLHKASCTACATLEDINSAQLLGTFLTPHPPHPTPPHASLMLQHFGFRLRLECKPTSLEAPTCRAVLVRRPMKLLPSSLIVSVKTAISVGTDGSTVQVILILCLSMRRYDIRMAGIFGTNC